MFATFILILFYRYDRVTAFLWIRYPAILLGEGLQFAYVRLQIILWLRNANRGTDRGRSGGAGVVATVLHDGWRLGDVSLSVGNLGRMRAVARAV
jgi:hypothetical protein